MRGLTIVAAREDSLGTAVEIACAQAALGGAAKLFLSSGAIAAVSNLERPLADSEQPQLLQSIATAIELGVTVIACQSGLATARIDLETLPEGIAGGGLVGLISSLGDDRLIAV